MSCLAPNNPDVKGSGDSTHVAITGHNLKVVKPIENARSKHFCGICRTPGLTEVLDLGDMPLANRLRATKDGAEARYPLDLHYCTVCGNLQLSYMVPPNELYDDYLYVTPTSATLEAHTEYLIAQLSARGLTTNRSFLLEFGSNVGAFLARASDHFDRVLGVDPASKIAEIANNRGIPTLCGYFSDQTAESIVETHGKADVVVGRHCAAHNPDPNALIRAARTAISDDGILVLENAYALQTVLRREIGQIYHEHMYYFTVRSVRELLKRNGFRLIDLFEANAVHGGSVVFFATPDMSRPERPVVAQTIEREIQLIDSVALDNMRAQPEIWRRESSAFFAQMAARGQTVWLYGASAKAATFVNLVGLTATEAPYCVDSTPGKIGRFLPGTDIEVISEARALEDPPDYFLVTAWNYVDELIDKTRRYGNHHTGFAAAFPHIEIVDDPAVARHISAE